MVIRGTNITPGYLDTIVGILVLGHLHCIIRGGAFNR